MKKIIFFITVYLLVFMGTFGYERSRILKEPCEQVSNFCKFDATANAFFSGAAWPIYWFFVIPIKIFS